MYYIQCCLLCDLQLQHQFPTSFEFSEALLHLLFTNSYSSEYGTFVYDCQRERLTNKVSDKTCSLWWVSIGGTYVLVFITARFSLTSSPVFSCSANTVNCSVITWKGFCIHLEIRERMTWQHVLRNGCYCPFIGLGECSRAYTAPTIAARATHVNICSCRYTVFLVLQNYWAATSSVCSFYPWWLIASPLSHAFSHNCVVFSFSLQSQPVNKGCYSQLSLHAYM